MTVAISKSSRVWTVADAQANLPEALWLAGAEGSQYIGAVRTFVVAPAEPEEAEPRMPLGKWVIENAPRGTNLDIPDDEYSFDEILWVDEAGK